jgi:ATP-binding cassette subfamily E protein 1
MYDYLQRLFTGDLNIAFKSQYVDELSHRSGTVTDFISPKMAKIFGLDKILNRKMSHLSGGELQQIAIAETLCQEANIYFFDEPSSYLDIDRRIFMARNIRELTKQNKMVMVVEHDLGVLDFLADSVHLIYGTKSVYGVVTQPKSVRHGINLYLSGYLKEENIRFGEEITFEVHPPSERNKRDPLLQFERLTKSFDAFTLAIAAGELCRGDVIGVVGPNAIGKTTFVKMLASSIEPTQGEVNAEVTVSYKPQYLRPIGGRVQDIFLTVTSLNPFYERNIIVPLGIDVLYDKKIKDLSGGELQSVAIALCLARQADIYLIDEPSAYLDANQRMNVAKVIKRIVRDQEVAALVVDHDVYFIDLVSQSLMVFTGDPEVWGKGQGPYDLRTGMNIFLKELDVTFRRDEDSNRPRVNKPGSRLDREQRRAGEYYYEPLD